MSNRSQLSQRAAWAKGQPISDLMSRALAAPKLISLAAGFVDQHTLPVKETRSALEAMLRDTAPAQSALQYGTTFGFGPLREALRDRQLTADGGVSSQPPIDVEQIVLTAGSNQLLNIVSESILDPGDIVLCAAPTYFVYLGALKNMGARAISVKTDDQGIVPESLEATLQSLQQKGQLSRVKAIYVVAYFDNPSGRTVTAQRREQIVELARKWSQEGVIYVLADDAYRELRYSGDDIPSMRCFDETGQQVVQAGTFSKCYSPGIRVGWGILPKSLIEPVHAQKGNLDFGSPNFSQHLMHQVMDLELLEPHIAQLRNAYRSKLTAMLDACQRHLSEIDGACWVVPQGGLYVWLTLPEHLDASMSGRLFDLALNEGMLYVPGQFCFAAEGQPVRNNTIRLSFGVQPAERIDEGLAKLAAAVRRMG